MDKKLDASVALADKDHPESRGGKLSGYQIFLIILKNKGWWYIAILCVLFYSAVFPFLKYASDLMVNKFGIDPDWSRTDTLCASFRNNNPDTFLWQPV